ncbi:hypothetical protein NXY00_18390 [Bacteroides sp. BFG-551]|nr:hypothetical protein [Bacteroides sp. BFG-551]
METGGLPDTAVLPATDGEAADMPSWHFCSCFCWRAASMPSAVRCAVPKGAGAAGWRRDTSGHRN